MRTYFYWFLILFSLQMTTLTEAKVDVGAPPKKAVATRSRSLLILGDSLTEGYGVPKNKAYPKILQQIMDQNKMNIKVVSAGISGSTTASAVKRLKWHLRSKPDYMILALGGNDGLRGLKLESTKEHLNQTIKLAKSNGVKVFLAGMKIPTNYGQDYSQNFAKLFTELSQENKVKLIPFLLEGVAGRKDLNLEDQIHPNEKGHELIAKTVFNSIREHL